MSIAKKIGGAAAISACVLAGGLIGAANYFYKFALVPKLHDPRHDLDPRWHNIVMGRRWMNEHVRRQDVFVLSEDHLQLHANFLRASDPDCHRYAICVHGYADTAESMGIFAKRYYEKFGMNVLLPDLRGHGASEGRYVGMGYHDAADLQKWIRFILDQDPQAIIILHGESMGAATVLLASGETLPQNVLAVIADSSYTSALDEFYSVYKTLHAPIPAKIMVPAVRLLALLRAHYDLGKAAPVEAVRKSRIPTLFIHGEADTFVPPEHMPQLFEAAACKKDFLWIRGAEHVEGVAKAPREYWQKVEQFLSQISPWILHENIKDTDPFVD